MDKYLVEFNINYSWNPQLHTLLIFLLYPLKTPFYYISGGLKGSVSHGAVSMMQWNHKIMISILIFTFYIINHISIIILYPVRLVFPIFRIRIAWRRAWNSQEAAFLCITSWRYETNVTQTSVNKERYWLTSTLLCLTARTRSHDWQMFCIEK